MREQDMETKREAGLSMAAQLEKAHKLPYKDGGGWCYFVVPADVNGRYGTKHLVMESQIEEKLKSAKKLAALLKQENS